MLNKLLKSHGIASFMEFAWSQTAIWTEAGLVIIIVIIIIIIIIIIIVIY
jgi:hypothetical protein